MNAIPSFSACASAGFSRRKFLRGSLLLSAGGAGLATILRASPAAADSTPIDLGKRRELFADDFLIGRLDGAELKLHKPEAREVVFECDRPWEGNTSAYFTVFQDNGRYRMYYRGSHFNQESKKAAHPEVTCYAESPDGLRWTKPELGMFEFNGSKRNNIVWSGVGTHNFTPFKDLNPSCAEDARYKALASNRGQGARLGLVAFRSADGLHWSLVRDEPVITHGAFDSQNLAFWDTELGAYRAYWRFFTTGRTDSTTWKPGGYRAIRTATSKDFVRWQDEADLEYGAPLDEHLYTNAIQPYLRAPQVLIGFPTRFQPKTQQVEPILMTSRDGRRFRRWREPLIPITAPQDRDGNRSNYMTWGLLQLPGQDRELSIYATEGYYTGPGSRVRRFTFRTDGFVSVHAAVEGGELITKPLRVGGRQLYVNFVTGAGGSIRVAVEDHQGKPIRGLGLADCLPMRGDEIDHPIRWKADDDLNRLAGQAVRLRFNLNNADLYAMRFA